MVAVVALPQVVAQDGYALGGVFLDAPAALGHVARDRVQELCRIESLVSGNQVLLFFVL